MRTPAMGVGRVVVVAAALISTLAGTVVAAPRAAASVDDVEMYLESYAAGQNVSNPEVDCVVSGSRTSRTRYPRVGRTDRSSFDDTVTVSDPDEPTDTSRYRLRGSAASRVVEVRGRVSTAHFSGRLHVDGDFSQARGGCQTDGAARVEHAAYVSLRRSTLVDVVVRTTGDVGGTFGFDGRGNGAYGTIDGFPGVRRTTVLVRPGSYAITGSFDVGLFGPVRSGPRSLTGTVDMRTTLTPAGIATTASSGPGRALVSLPAERRCRTRSLTVRLRPGAGRLDRVVFHVNGRRSAVVGTPAAGRSVVLRRLPATRSLAVRAVLDPKQGRTTAVSRRYAACSA